MLQYVRDVLNVTVEGHEKSTQPTATYAQLTAMKKQKLEELKKAYRFIGECQEDSGISAEASFLFVNLNVCITNCD